MRRSKQRTVAFIRQCLDRPKWWNEAFARHNQKQLQAFGDTVWDPRKAPAVLGIDLGRPEVAVRYRRFYDIRTKESPFFMMTAMT